MVITCKICTIKWNDDTISQCPSCYFNSKNKEPFRPKHKRDDTNRYLNNEYIKLHHKNYKTH